MELDTVVQALQSGGFLVGQVQENWILQGDPQYALVPAGSNEEIEITLVPRPPRPVSDDGTKPPELGFRVRSDNDDDSHEHRKYFRQARRCPTRTTRNESRGDRQENARGDFRDTCQGPRSSGFGQGNKGPQTQKRVKSVLMDQVRKWKLRPRDEWPNHRSPEVPVAFDRPQEDGGSVQKECLTPGACVAFDVSQEPEELFYRCQGPNCSKQNEGRRYLDSASTVFYAEDGKRTHKDISALNAGRQALEVSLPSDLSDLNKCSCGREFYWRSNLWKISGLKP